MITDKEHFKLQYSLIKYPAYFFSTRNKLYIVVHIVYYVITTTYHRYYKYFKTFYIPSGIITKLLYCYIYFIREIFHSGIFLKSS